MKKTKPQDKGHVFRQTDYAGEVKFLLTCPKCGKKGVSPGHILGHSRSPAKAKSSRINGRKFLLKHPKGKYAKT